MSRILVADVPHGEQVMRKMLADVFDFVPATKVDEALQLILDADADAIVCGIHFDDSRMFDLLRLVKANDRLRGIPFICFRDLESDLGAPLLQSLEIASKALGAEMFIDLFALKQRVGVAKADKELRRLLLGVVKRRVR